MQSSGAFIYTVYTHLYNTLILPIIEYTVVHPGLKDRDEDYNDPKYINEQLPGGEMHLSYLYLGTWDGYQCQQLQIILQLEQPDL